MKKLTSIFLCIVLILSACHISAFAQVGTTYYIDSINGDDSLSGLSENNAWRTLSKASSITYSAGDKILFRAGGVYIGSFCAKGNGTEENPITVSSYGDISAEGRPIIASFKDETLFLIHNVNNWVIENLELTAPEGKGFTIIANGNENIMKNITVRNCSVHNVWYHNTPSYRGNYAAFFISGDGSGTRIENLTLSDISIYDCAYGIVVAGNTIEWAPDIYVSPEESYNQNFLFERINFNNILYDGIIVGSMNDSLIKDCSLINTALNSDYPTAPLWMHHANNVVVDSCEIAGSTNTKDGMAVDFDGWTTNSTYQYVYSHDNIRFMQNCVYDNTTKNNNCTVRYCLSVNDNVLYNKINLLNSDSYTDDDNPEYMDNFKFYNNTIVNGSFFIINHLRNAVFANNIFSGDITMRFETSVRTTIPSGERLLCSYTGLFTNNCFDKTAIPPIARNSYIVNPMFTGSDLTDKNSFRLSSSSPLIGKGIQVEEDMGEHDFFGNSLSDTHNIGCYEGTGVEDGQEAEKGIQKILRDLYTILARLYNAVYNFTRLF